MYKITVNDTNTIPVDQGKDSIFIVNERALQPDIVEVQPGMFSILLNNKSYNAEVVHHDKSEKTFLIKINNNQYKIQVQDRYDELLKELGMDALHAKKVSDLKAPMPGLVVEVAVSEGQEIKKGDKLVVLEAMKMENILKSPADGVVKKVNVKKGNTVEKNEVLILFS
jgi:acetyl/propionyl-CoA carboxylase alpha subunit